MNTKPMKTAAERPSPVAIARALAEHFAALEDFDGDAGNFERQQCHDIAGHLYADPPAVREALEAAERGIGHHWRGSYSEDRPEGWACAAIAHLLRGAA